MTNKKEPYKLNLEPVNDGPSIVVIVQDVGQVLEFEFEFDIEEASDEYSYIKKISESGFWNIVKDDLDRTRKEYYPPHKILKIVTFNNK